MDKQIPFLFREENLKLLQDCVYEYNRMFPEDKKPPKLRQIYDNILELRKQHRLEPKGTL